MKWPLYTSIEANNEHTDGGAILERLKAKLSTYT